MVHARDAMHTSAYIVNKLKLADVKRDTLANELNRLVKLSYENGSREGDSIIRKKVKAVVDEINLYYRNVQTFISGKGGDTDAFTDILIFFNARYLEEFQLTVQLDQIKYEIVHQEKQDQEFNASNPRRGYIRKQNIFARILNKDLTEWERKLLNTVIPLLRHYLIDINDIVLYYQIEDRIKKVITGNNVFSLSGEDYQSFKKNFLYHLDLYIKLTRKPVSDSEITELINQLLQQMGFRSLILKCQNITPDKYKDMLAEILKDGNFKERSLKYAETPKEVITPLKKIESKQEEIVSVRRKILRVLEYLCNLEEIKAARQSVLTKDAAKNDAERYVFHKPGTFDVSLKFVSEYMRNSMIMITDWLQKELQKNQNYLNPLRPVFECIPSIQQFISCYKFALDVSTDKKGRAVSGSDSRENLYIPQKNAIELIQIIYENCHKIRQSLVDSSNNLNKTKTVDSSVVLLKKIKLIMEAFDDSVAKISKGLSELEKS
jgi:hypothetical protein